MATDNPLRLSAEAQTAIVQYVRAALTQHKALNDFRTKMELIDVAYARYKSYARDMNGDGIDTLSKELESCGIVMDEIIVPIIVSQVDSFVSYLSDVYLSGYPIFPVVSGPQDIQEAEALTAIIDSHAQFGQYARHLKMSFYDDAKYNFSAIEVDWAQLDDYSVLSSYEQITANNSRSKLKASRTAYNKLRRCDPYNTIFDRSVAPVDVPHCGQFAGYVEMISPVELARRLQYYAATGNGYNTSQALMSKLAGGIGEYYVQAPIISDIMQVHTRHDRAFDWDTYLARPHFMTAKKPPQYSSCYEFTTLYARIIPNLLAMTNVPERGTPQVWKFVVVNHDKLVYAERMYNAYNTLPIYFAQPIEDGFHLQTPTIAESAIPFQQGASKLFSIRLNAARRAIMDRAIYDTSLINPAHIDSPHPAPKIPLRDNGLISGKSITDSYYPIPFDPRGTENVMQDMSTMLRMADSMNGFNQPMQGQFQRGNKSRKEWDDTMEGARSKLRDRAHSVEIQQLQSLKMQVKLNIYQYGATGNYQSKKTGVYYKVDDQMLQRIKDKIHSFKTADGLNPAEKLASSDVLLQGLQTVSGVPILQQQLGAALPRMFLHIMSLAGVTGFDQYLPQEQQPQGVVNGQPGMPPTTSTNTTE